MTETNEQPIAAELSREEPVEKPKRNMPAWKDLSYATRMTLSFAAIALMTALVSIFVLSIVWEGHFRSYTRTNMETAAASVAERIGYQYEEVGGWSTEAISIASSIRVVYPGIGIMVMDSNGNVRYDSSTLNETTVGGAATPSLVPTSPEQLVIAQIVANGQEVGSVRVWVYGSDALLTQADREFRANSYSAVVLAAILAIILASVIGHFFARNLVRPINTMMKTAKAIKDGDLTARTGLAGEDELSRLGSTFDEMAESVEKDRELERRLTSDVAHELRTPLMAIQSTVEAMVDGVFEPTSERLETVDAEVQRLSRLVDAILKLSRLESRERDVKKDIVDVGEVVQNLVSSHEAFINDSGLELVSHVQSGVLVRGDADLIMQATANLISNAVRYTPEGGTITVTVKRGEIMASIAVEDTGIGLTPEEAKMVFSRFWRSDAGRNRASGGLGIGLTLVKEIVEQHGGWVQVEGRKDQGARFTIHIPLYDEKRERELAKAAKRKQNRKGKGGQQAKKK